MRRSSFVSLVTVATLVPFMAHADDPLAERLRKVEVKQFARASSYSEGPTWRDGELFFCAGALMRVDKDGRTAKYLDINPAGTVLRGNGHLLIADNKYHAILDLSPDGVLSVVADQCDGKPLRNLNDLTVDARGNVYWTDPEGSTLKNPVGRIYRVTPAGVVSQIADGLAFPNGLDVDPQSKFLYLIESQTKKILRYDLPADDQPLGKPTLFFDLAGSGGDGCVFDAAGNFWVADFHRPETNRGRITVLSPEAKVIGQLDIPAKVVSNITFGGPNRDELFCTTGTPDGVFHAKVGVKGFAGHPATELKLVRRLPVRPEEEASSVHPRRFGLPGGVGVTRGWYVWEKWDPQAWQAEVRHEERGDRYTVRVLPWMTTYRHLVYGAHPDELLPGERVNLFFNPDEKQQRAYLVHFQDEIGQMKGHNHAWQVESVTADGFTARVMAGDKPLDDRVATFVLDRACRMYRGGKRVESAGLARGDRLYLTWVYDDKRRVVKWLSDAASLDIVKAEENRRVADRIDRDGMAGFVEEAADGKAHVLVFATYWSQVAEWKPGDAVRIQACDATYRATGARVDCRVVSRKNLGTYGSGATELVVEGTGLNEALVRGWVGSKVVRLFAARPAVPKE
jgi:gluconolactonase